MPIVAVAQQQGADLRGANILDLGCGVGRQLVHFTRHLANNSFFACDIDDLSIDFIKKHYRQVEAHVRGLRPPLAYCDRLLHVVYSVSIFSHLHADDIPPWLAELTRITKPGGLIVLKTEGPSALERLSAEFGVRADAMKGQLDEKGILYKTYGSLQGCLENQNRVKSASLLGGVEGSYGNTVLSPGYIRRTWESERGEVVDVLEGIADFRQDLFVLKRR